jgi:hypothetical protein
LLRSFWIPVYLLAFCFFPLMFSKLFSFFKNFTSFFSWF